MRFKDLQAKISIHALQVEGDSARGQEEYCKGSISIHALQVEGDVARHGNGTILPKISIHALQVEGDSKAFTAHRRFRISIHALQVEGDGCSSLRLRFLLYFYPRPPGGGRRWGRWCQHTQ